MTNTYQNPVVRGLAPDPSVVRVGNDYFLATSSMDLWPGIPIRHSTDLVHWNIIGAAVSRPGQYRRDGREGAFMLYAPTLRHHAGRFYLACTNVADQQGNFIVSTTDPTGDWSDAAWVDTEAFDPSLCFADDTCYYTRRTLRPRPDGRLGPVVQAEIDPDTGILLGPMRELSPDYGGFCTDDIEGPHLYKIDGWYYLFSAEGSTWKGHLQSCARSVSPWGPFEPCPHNPVLTHRHRVGHPIQTLGHADLVQTQDGSWWAVALGTRHQARGGFVDHHNLGRETFLAPVEWVNGWPVIGRDGTLELEMTARRPLPAGASTVIPPSDLLNAGWYTHGPPAPGTTGDPIAGDFYVAFGQDLGEPGRDGELLLSQSEDEATFIAELPTPAVAGSAAGIGVSSDALHQFSLLVRLDGTDRSVDLRRQADDLITRHSITLPGRGPTRLRIDATAEAYRFYADDHPIGQGSARLLSAETAEAFVGVAFALLAVGPNTLPPAAFRHVQLDAARK